MYNVTCLCGGIKLKILASLNPINICHCKQCQKAQGGAFVAITQVNINDLQIIEGQSLMKEFYSSPNKKRVFCGICGSPIFSARSDKPEVIRLRVGIIDEYIEINVISHAYIDFKASWDIILDDACQFKNSSL